MSSVGLLAIFPREKDFIRAVKAARVAGLIHFEPLSPYAIEEVSQAAPPVPGKFNRLGIVALGGGLFGASLGLFMQWYANSISYVISSGGKPSFSWPNFVPICFALMILCAALSTLLALFLMMGLPQPYHSAFNVPALNLSEDRFYIYFSNTDPKIADAKSCALRSGATSVEEVAP